MKVMVLSHALSEMGKLITRICGTLKFFSVDFCRVRANKKLI